MIESRHRGGMKSAMPCSSLLPGVALCGGVTLAAHAVADLEAITLGRSWLEALVLAILIGTLVRTAWQPTVRCDAGIRFAASTLLEVAVVLMGATISFGIMLDAGPRLLFSIVATVCFAIVASFLLGRALGLPCRMALLIACGNAICGNSAIAAVAPVIDAEGDDVGTAIAFTAVLGIAVVLVLPVVSSLLHLSGPASGVLAGLTVYAVPQVLAAAGPMGHVAVQWGTLVKLIRVLMLGPLVVSLALVRPADNTTGPSATSRHDWRHLLPGFIVGFLTLAAARSLGWVPDAWADSARALSSVLTVVAMAGLGLGVDLRHVWAAGLRVSVTVTASLLLLGLAALVSIHGTGLA